MVDAAATPLLSARAASERLSTVGVPRRHARRVLASGLAGEPTRLRSATLYDACRVDELVAWAVLEDTEIEAACPSGLFIGRRELDLTAGPPRRLEEAGSGWDVPAYTRVWIRHRVELHGFLPLVVTVSGFVGLGADIVGVHVTAQREQRLELREPGEWFDGLRRRRLVTGPGPPFLVRGWHPSAGGEHPGVCMGH